MDSITDSEFPIVSLLPKKETGVLNFLGKYPEYDGRGVVIAIFDSGVDPGAPGLQVTSDGKPKVIERFDCSGAGDIDTSTVVTAQNGEIKGLSGRTLKIPATWNNPSGDYRIGMRNAYDLLNTHVRDRVKKQRKEKKWDKIHKIIFASCSNTLQNFNKECSSKAELSRDEKLMKEDLQGKVDALKLVDEKYNDPGPVYDFVLFHDGEQWWAVMDTSEKGDLASCTLLTEFSKVPSSFSTFPYEQAFTYSFNVHDEGSTLEIVTCVSSHGTHVASIAAACFPEEPSKNGIAPGAQIISLTIADNRIGTMETGTALSRAMIRIMRNCRDNKKVHVINMSYGEMSHFSNAGRIGELMNKVVDKYGLVWIVSGGNHGPALFTVGSPPDISTTNMIGVGAYVSPEMMAAEYAMRDKCPAACYSWSSRGPTMDGDRGITVCAPGGAFTSVPNYTLKSAELLNGTSMAAPHVSGAVALLISGLLQRNIPYSPYFIKRTLENTAYFHESYDYFAQGCGLLQVEKAFDHLISYYKEVDCNVRFHISCANVGAKGIVIRSDCAITDTNVSVEPVFLNDDEIDPKVKIDFSMYLVLACEATWVSAPKYLALVNSTRTFNVRVDSSSLATGVHGTCIRAYDTQKPDKGPVFRVYITVLKPDTVDLNSLHPNYEFKNVPFGPNTIRRHFIRVPDNVTFAVINVVATPQSTEKVGRYVVHCLQTQPRKSCSTLEFHKTLQIYDKNETPLAFRVKGGLILEIVLAKFWSSLGEMKLNYNFQFGGCRPSQSEIVMHHAEGLYSLNMLSSIHTEEVEFKAKLKNNVIILKPSDSCISPLLSKRDIIPPVTVIYQLVLTYNFHINKTTEVTIISPLLSEYLYESDFESQLWMLYDSNNRYIMAGDAYPENYNTKLEKGEYVVQHQIRHDRKDLLEKLSDMNLLLSQKLTSALTLDAYTSSHNALNGKKLKNLTLIGQSKIQYPLYIGPVANDKLPKSITVGQYLSGSAVFTKDSVGKKVDSYPIKYFLADVAKKTKSPENPTKSKNEEFQDAHKDFMANWIAKFGKMNLEMETPQEQAAWELYQKLKRKMKDHLPIHTAMLQNLEPESRRYLPGSDKNVPVQAYLLEVMCIADCVINAVNQTELLSFLGAKNDPSGNVTAQVKQSYNQQKLALVEAMGRKGCAQCQYHLLYDLNQSKSEENKPDKPPKFPLETIDALWINLTKFVSPHDVKETYYFALWHAAVFSHYGRLAKLLLKFSEDKSSSEIDSCLRWTFSKLQWHHCYKFYSDKLLVHYPSRYQSF